MTERLSTAELSHLIERPGVILLDLRPTAAFNGWALGGEARGGHIPGAVPCPEQWTRGLAGEALAAVLAKAGATPEKTVVVYGNAGADYGAMLARLEALSFSQLFFYQPGFQAWAAALERPVERLPRYEKLVYPGWLSRLLAGENPETFSRGRYLLFHVNFGAEWEYQANHLPGAIYLDTNLLESEVDWNRRSPKELLAALASLGITPDTTVVLYGRSSEPSMADEHPGRKAGMIAATRAAMILMYAGVEDVRLLDGGYDAWVAAGYPVERATNQPQPVPTFGLPVPQNPQFIVDLEEAKEILSRSDAELVSIRSWHEFIGETSGYHYIGRVGRIAGAVWGDCGSDAYHMQNYRNMDNTMRDYHQIAANWSKTGVTPDKRIAFYCGTGWRASETFFYAYLMGWDKMAVYDGGWFEWSVDPNNPTETGIPKGMQPPAGG
jgi:thiosulfate/3-mercaptopyruvate sulfurtransferase